MKDLFKGCMTIPNLLSVVRILLVPAFVYYFIQGDKTTAIILLAVSGLTDFLDGKIARKFNQISALGKLLDPLADKLTQVAIALVLFWYFNSSSVHTLQLFSYVFLAFLGKEGLMLVMSAVMLSMGLRPCASEIYGKVATFTFYVVMIVIICFGPEVGAFSGIYTMPEWLVMALVIISLVLTIMALVSYIPADEKKESDWEFVVKMMCIIKDLMNGNPNLPAGCEEEMVGHNAIAAGFQGQRQWTDFYPNCDYPEALLNTTFDWNGAREPYILATENDVLNGISMLFGKLLTNRAQAFADVRTYWSPEAVKEATGYDLEGVAKESQGFIHLINSGAACLDFSGESKDENGNPIMKEWYDVNDADIDAMLKATTWCAADNGYFRGGGYSSRFETKAEMPVTMLRLNLVKGVGPVLQIAEGYTVKLPDEVSDKLWKRTDYTWPCTWFAPRLTGEGAFKSAYDVMNNWGANHGSITYGHIGADLITLCSMLRIPVCMHNVPEEKIFRPAAWNAFGMDKEGQDYRACATYGPLYK